MTMFGLGDQESTAARKEALRRRLLPDLTGIPLEVQKEAVFARHPAEGRRPGVPPMRHPLAEATAISAQPPEGFSPEPQPVVSAEPEVAATAPVFRMPERRLDAAPLSSGAEEDEEKVLGDAREYWRLTREIRTLEGEKACRERTVKDRQEAYDQALEGLTKLVSNGGSNPGTQYIGAVAAQLERAKNDLSDWLEQSKYLEQRRKYDDLTKRMRRYFPFL